MDITTTEPTPSAGRYDHRAFRMVGVVSPRLEPLVVANTVGHMLVALGAGVGLPLLGRSHLDADGIAHAPLARFPFILLTTKPAKIARLLEEARALPDLTVVDYPEEGYTTTHDDDYGAALSTRSLADLVYIGAAFFGPAPDIEKVCGRLTLWRPR